MEGHKEVAPKVDMSKDTLDKIRDVQRVKGNHYDQTAKKWKKRRTRKMDRNTSKQQQDQRLMESQQELFISEHLGGQPPKK
jgi:hypothetical protein